MRACARCAPPRAPDVALLLVVLVAALVVALETTGVAAEDHPCASAHHRNHRNRRTTPGLGSPTSSDTTATSALPPGGPGDVTFTTSPVIQEQQLSFTSPGLDQLSSTDDDLSHQTLSSPGINTAPAEAATLTDYTQPPVVDPGFVPQTGALSAPGDIPPPAPPLPSQDLTPPTAADLYANSAPSGAGLTAEPAGELPATPADVLTPPRSQTQAAPQRPSLSWPNTGRDVSLPGDVAVGVGAAKPLKDTANVLPKRTSSRTAVTPRTAALLPAARAARLQEERVRRLEKIQKDVLERKHRRPIVTEAPIEEFDLDADEDLDVDLLDKDKPWQGGRTHEPTESRRPPHVSENKRQGGGSSSRQHDEFGAKQEGAVKKPRVGAGSRQKDQDDDVELLDHKQTRGRAGKKSEAQPRRASTRSRQRDLDEDESVEDNSLSDGSWESAATGGGFSGEWGGLVCPRTDEVSVFSRQCKSDRDCKSVGEQCCKDRLGLRRCVLGVVPIMPDISHEPFFGVIARVCPTPVETLVEPWSITNCTTDDDCWPRVCCVDGPYAYCRTPQLEWEKLPGQRFVAPLRLMMSYLQCTPPPPPVFDLFPKPCRNTLDCFPNLCCQERGRKVCRPPKRSLLALLATLGQGAGYSITQQRNP